MSLEKLARPEIFTLSPYVPGKPVDEVKRELGLTEVIKLASNENPLGPSPRAMAAIAGMAEQAHIYPDASAFRLKQALSERYGLPTDHFIIGDGSDEIIKLICEVFVGPGDEAVVPSPSFPVYDMATKLMSGAPVYVPLKDGRLDIPAMISAFSDRTKLVFICNPNNPTGTIVTRAEVDQLMGQLPPDAIVVFDEAYFEYVEDADYPDGLAYLRAGQPVIVLRTFSKIFGLAGLRVGYGITYPDAVGLLNRPRLAFNVNSIAQAAAIAALGDDEHVAESRRVNRQGRDYLYREFAAMGLEYLPTQANFVLVNIGLDSATVFQGLLRRGVIVRPAHIFGLNGWQRVTIGTAEENRKFIEALREVITELKE